MLVLLIEWLISWNFQETSFVFEIIIWHNKKKMLIQLYLWAVFLQVLDKSRYGKDIHHKQEISWWFIHGVQRSK